MTFAILIASVLLAVQPYEMLKIPTAGAEAIVGRLSLPAEGFRNVLVADVPGSGPNTFGNRRRIGRTTEVRYHDLFAAELARRGVPYFSYNTRYTEVDENTPPTFDRVDKARFSTITPAERVQDLENIIRHLRKDPRLARGQVLLLGWSEGSIIASLVAERKQVPIDGLFLAGVPADDAYATILWQHSGEASMANMRKFFDADKDGRITRTAYESGDPRARARVGNKTFDDLDVNRDAVLTADEVQALSHHVLRNPPGRGLAHLWRVSTVHSGARSFSAQQATYDAISDASLAQADEEPVGACHRHPQCGILTYMASIAGGP